MPLLKALGYLSLHSNMLDINFWLVSMIWPPCGVQIMVFISILHLQSESHWSHFIFIPLTLFTCWQFMRISLKWSKYFLVVLIVVCSLQRFLPDTECINENILFLCRKFMFYRKLLACKSLSLLKGSCKLEFTILITVFFHCLNNTKM